MSPDTYVILGTIWLGVSFLEQTLWRKVFTGGFGIYWIVLWAAFK